MEREKPEMDKLEVTDFSLGKSKAEPEKKKSVTVNFLITQIVIILGKHHLIPITLLERKTKANSYPL
jgi:hypothetical protein